MFFFALFLSALTFATDFDPKNMAPYIREKAVTLDWSLIGKSPEKVIYIGEDHFSIALKSELAQHFQQLKASGVTHLGIEVLDDVVQAILNDFMRDGSRREELRSQIHDHGWGKEGYMMVFEAARLVGLKMVSLNLPFDPHYTVEENVAYRCSDKRKSTHPCTNKQLNCVMWDCWMASIINQELTDDSAAKFVVLIGNVHVQKRMQPKYLDEYGIASRSYMFNYPGKTNDPFQASFNKAVQEAGHGKNKVLIPLPAAQVNVDGIIYVPDVFDGK